MPPKEMQDRTHFLNQSIRQRAQKTWPHVSTCGRHARSKHTWHVMADCVASTVERVASMKSFFDAS